MRKILLILSVALFSAACSDPEVIDLGLVVSLTGNYSPLLTTARNGALLAVEQINESDRRLNFNLMTEDDESFADVTESKVNKLLGQDPDFLMMSVTSGNYARVDSLLMEQEILVLSPTVSSDLFSERDDNLIRMTPDISSYALYLTNYAIENGSRRVVIIYDENNMSYADFIKKTYYETLDASGRRPETHEIGFNSLESPLFNEIGRKTSGFLPDAVLIIASAFDAALICQHFHGEDYLKLLAPWAFSEELIKNGGPDVEGVVAFINDESGRSEEEYEAFVSAYRSRFRSEPSYQSLTNYETVLFLYELLKSSKERSAAAVKAAAIESGGYRGISLRYELDEFGDCSHPLLPYTVRDGEIVRLE